MPLSREEWHQRFKLQARWTEALRLYFFELLKTNDITAVLDMGCGTGALLPDLQSLSSGVIWGADIELEHLDLARTVCPECRLAGANVHHLPFSDSSFEVVLCHYFLMWVGDPGHALAEMRRVAKPGGFVVAFAEPDYGGRIDYPPEFFSLRDDQISGLLEQGADPRMGRKLKGLFQSQGFSNIESGVYQGRWSSDESPEEINSEWKILAEDLAGTLTIKELGVLRKHDQAARMKGTRLIYVPTFYAWGKVDKGK